LWTGRGIRYRVCSPGVVLLYDEEKIGAIKPCPHVVKTLPLLRDRRLKLGFVTDAHNGNVLKRLRKAGLKRIF